MFLSTRPPSNCTFPFFVNRVFPMSGQPGTQPLPSVSAGAMPAADVSYPSAVQLLGSSPLLSLSKHVRVRWPKPPATSASPKHAVWHCPLSQVPSLSPLSHSGSLHGVPSLFFGASGHSGPVPVQVTVSAQSFLAPHVMVEGRKASGGHSVSPWHTSTTSQGPTAPLQMVPR